MNKAIVRKLLGAGPGRFERQRRSEPMFAYQLACDAPSRGDHGFARPDVIGKNAAHAGALF